MTGFIGELILLDCDPEGEWFKVMSPFGFEDSSGRVWWCRPGQLVNGASIPRFFWRLVGAPMTGRYRRAACLHDCAYQLRETTREAADDMFLEAMDACDVGWLKRHTMWVAVRLAGGAFWSSK